MKTRLESLQDDFYVNAISPTPSSSYELIQLPLRRKNKVIYRHIFSFNRMYWIQAFQSVVVTIIKTHIYSIAIKQYN